MNCPFCGKKEYTRINKLINGNELWYCTACKRHREELGDRPVKRLDADVVCAAMLVDLAPFSTLSE